jgi:hypothetical protein
MFLENSGTKEKRPGLGRVAILATQLPCGLEVLLDNLFD